MRRDRSGLPAARPGLGEARRREALAKAKAERNQVSPETREARAAILEARDALRDQQQAAAKAERDASPDALRAILARGTVDELSEVARMISRLDGRRMQDIVNEVFRDKSRTAYVAAEAPAAVTETAPSPAVPDAPEKAASESLRRRGRPPGTRAA